MKIDLRQESRYRGKDWWQWSVYLDGPEEELNRIDHVVYTLHPTFPTPVRQVSDRSSNFRLDASGWGEFQIFADVILKDGKHEHKKHWLKLEYPATQKRVVQPSGAKVKAGANGKPAVFLSSSVADIAITREMRSALVEAGLEVITINDLPAGLPWEKSIPLLLRRAVAAIFIISGNPSPYIEKEIEAALAQSVGHILPILFGPEPILPERLRSFQGIRIKDPSEIEPMVRRIAEAALGYEK